MGHLGRILVLVASKHVAFTVMLLVGSIWFPVSVTAEPVWIVTNKSAALAYPSTNTQNPPKSIFPFGYTFKGDRYASWIKTRSGTYIKRSDSKLCTQSIKSKGTIERLQQCLNYMGFKAGKVDGSFGGATKAAIRRFEQKYYLKANSLTPSCAYTLVCSVYRQKANARTDERRKKQELRSRQTKARKLFLKGKCIELKEFTAQEQGENSFAKCKAIVDREKAAKKFASLLNAGLCEQAEGIANSESRQKRVKECFSKRVQKILRTLVANGKCKEATRIFKQTGYGKTETAACYAQQEKEKKIARLKNAVQNKECGIIKKLERQLGKTGQLEKCHFAVALALTDERQMFMSAIRYDVDNKRAKAQLLYKKIMARFPENDIAIQAAMRLAAINDQMISEAARARTAQKMAKLQKQVVDSQKEAMRAQARADRARAKAQQASRQLSYKKSKSAAARKNKCGHVYPGKYFRITQRKAKNASGVLGTILSATLMGNHFLVQGVNARAGVATACSTDSGKCFEFACSKIP